MRRAASFDRRHASREHRQGHAARDRRPSRSWTRGELVPDSLVLKMVADRIEQPDCCARLRVRRFSADRGAGAVLEVLLAQHGYKPPLVVHFAIDPALLLRRITGRRMCKVGGEIYNIYERRPKVEGRCDNDGGELEQRARRSRRNCRAAAASVREADRAAGCVLQAAGPVARRGCFAGRGGSDAAGARDCRLVQGSLIAGYEPKWRFICAARKSWKRCTAPDSSCTRF